MGRRNPRVSIGIPVFNGERFLGETLESILTQSYEDIEVIISDNASSDGTADICMAAAGRDSRVHYHRNPHNVGIAPNCNRTFALATGEYYKLADYDDLLAPEFVARCVEELERHPQAAVCFPRTRLIDDAGRLIRDFEPPASACSPHAHVRFRSLILEPDHIVSQASGLMRSELVRRTAGHLSFPCSDEVFLAHLALLGDFVQVPERLFSYRLHERQSTKGALASDRARVALFDTALKGRAIPIRWLYFKACLAAIRQSPMSSGEKSLCRWYMTRWLLRPKNIRSVAKDGLLTLHERTRLFPRLYRETVEASQVPHHYE